MDGPPQKTAALRSASRPARSEELARLLFFVLFSTIGMAALSLALLARPLAHYYADQDLLQARRQRIERLQQLHEQQQQLLANLSNPAVVERAAIEQLNYVPADAAGAPAATLPAVWPELERALARLNPPAPAPQPPAFRRTINRLAAEDPDRLLLAALGAGLVLISLTCFPRRP